MKRKIAIAVAAVLLLGVVAYRIAAWRGAAVKPPEAPVEGVLVTSARVARQDVPERVALTGTVRPRNEVEVQSKLAGRIASVHAQVGDRVRAGQLLAVVEHDELAWQSRQADAAVLVARAGVDGAQLELDRTRKLFDGGSVAPAQLDAARVKLDAARAQLAQAEAAAGLARQLLANARVVSPIAGTVARRPVDVGAQITTSTSLFTVQDAASLKLETSVDAATYARLKRGDAATVTADALPGQRFPAKVSLLSPALDPQSRRAAIELAIEAAPGRLLPNTFVHAEITVGVLRDALVVPRDALLDAPGGVTAYRLRGGRAEAVRPRLGATDGARAVVLGGLAEGDEVATSGLSSLSDGAAVRAAPAQDGARAER